MEALRPPVRCPHCNGEPNWQEVRQPYLDEDPPGRLGVHPLLGSLVAYLLVRRYGEALILGPGRRVGLTAGHLRLANRFFVRWGLPAVFAGRLLPVIRTYISFPAGLSRITVVPFTVATTLGAIPWNLALAYAGFALGQNYERVASALGPFTIPLAVLLLLAIVAAYYYGRRIGEAEAG